MRAHVLSIGSELLLGHITDTNATFLAQDLAANGIELRGVTQVGDDRTRIADAIRSALAEADVVICTGGIGPTDDDLTREAIADVVGERPEVDPALLQHLKEYFAGRGLEMPERNAKQAWRIPSATILPNPVGTAPGWLVNAGTARIVTMPGVPREMKRMWQEQALPRLVEPGSTVAIRSTTIRTVGIGESAAEQLLDDLVKRASPTVATYAKDDGVHVTVTARASTVSAAVAARDTTAVEVERRLRPYVYGRDETTLPQSLIALLRARGLTISVVARGTGSRFVALLAASPEAAAILRGATLDTVGNQTAAELAGAALTQFNASLGVGAAVAVEPVGAGIYAGMLTVALRGARESDEQHPTRASFDEVQRRAALTIADAVRRALAGPS